MNILVLFLLPILLFMLGILGILINRKSVILIIFCIELTLLAINFFLFLVSFFLDDIFGQILVIFILTTAASETSIGLALLIIYFRSNGTISIEQIGLLCG